MNEPNPLTLAPDHDLPPPMRAASPKQKKAYRVNSFNNLNNAQTKLMTKQMENGMFLQNAAVQSQARNAGIYTETEAEQLTDDFLRGGGMQTVERMAQEMTVASYRENLSPTYQAWFNELDDGQQNSVVVRLQTKIKNFTEGLEHGSNYAKYVSNTEMYKQKVDDGETPIGLSDHIKSEAAIEGVSQALMSTAPPDTTLEYFGDFRRGADGNPIDVDKAMEAISEGLFLPGIRPLMDDMARGVLDYDIPEPIAGALFLWGGAVNKGNLRAYDGKMYILDDKAMDTFGILDEMMTGATQGQLAIQSASDTLNAFSKTDELYKDQVSGNNLSQNAYQLAIGVANALETDIPVTNPAQGNISFYTYAQGIANHYGTEKALTAFTEWFTNYAMYRSTQATGSDKNNPNLAQGYMDALKMATALHTVLMSNGHPTLMPNVTQREGYWQPHSTRTAEDANMASLRLSAPPDAFLLLIPTTDIGGFVDTFDQYQTTIAPRWGFVHNRYPNRDATMANRDLQLPRSVRMWKVDQWHVGKESEKTMLGKMYRDSRKNTSALGIGAIAASVATALVAPVLGIIKDASRAERFEPRSDNAWNEAAASIKKDGVWLPDRDSEGEGLVLWMVSPNLSVGAAGSIQDQGGLTQVFQNGEPIRLSRVDIEAFADVHYGLVNDFVGEAMYPFARAIVGEERELGPTGLTRGELVINKNSFLYGPDSQKPFPTKKD